MAVLVFDPQVEERLKEERQASGADRYDEVWEGVYMMAPLANNEHQELQLGLAAAIKVAVGWNGPARVLAGANVSDREDDWEFNYRIPDVVVVYPGGAARDCGTHWCGGPDFCVEIASRGDRSRDKTDFYARIGVRELMLVDRNPWALELYRLTAGRLEPTGRSEPAGSVLASTIVPASFRLVPGVRRPMIEVVHNDGVQRWTV
jgi:Uma2 family endonuclease